MDIYKLAGRRRYITLLGAEALLGHRQPVAREPSRHYVTWAPVKSLIYLGNSAGEPRRQLEQNGLSLFCGMEGEGRIGATQG